MSFFEDLIEDSVASEDEDLPKYSDRGWIIFDRLPTPDGEEFSYFSDIELVSYDSDSSVMWMNEGAGIDYWLDCLVALVALRPGRYVMTGVNGQYIRGDGWTSDDDEEFYYEELTQIPDDKEDWP